MLLRKSEKTTVGMMVVLMMMFSIIISGYSQEYLQSQPLRNTISASRQPVKSGALQVYLITWGGDVATIYTQMSGIYAQQGLNVALKHEDKFAEQVKACISGETPFIRGTMGMINAAAEAFKAADLDLAVIYQLTWSTGGDAIVVRPGIQRPADLAGKKIALQLYGPHMDYVANILSTAKVPMSPGMFYWLEELTFPTYDTGGKIIDPVSAFQQDNRLSAAMCIIPDALLLTSGGQVGTGAEGSVQGANILLSTKTASRIIADVYAVRKDYLDTHRDTVEKFVRALMLGQEATQDLIKNKSTQQSKYLQLLAEAAGTLLGAPGATADVEALIGDCEFVGYDGNVQFFTGQGTTRTLEKLNTEIQSSFKQMGLMSGSVDVNSAGWDYAALAKGLKYATLTPSKAGTPVAAKPKAKPKPSLKFDAQKVAKKVEAQIQAEPETWAAEGTLFTVEIYFEPNQHTFPEADYAADFKDALEIAQTYGGSLITIEGHSDPLGIQRAERDASKLPAEIAQMKQKAKNLSEKRAQSVRLSFIKFCKKRGFEIDESQFVPIGVGIASPKYPKIKTEQQWNENRRVVFRIKQVEAELTEFEPLD